MEVRFLVDDLKLTPKDPEPPKHATPLVEPPKPAEPQKRGQGAEGEKVAGSPAAPPAGGVSLTVDQIARPGAVVSGKVTFSDGQKADWYMDQTGRLGMVPRAAGLQTIRRQRPAIPSRAAKRAAADGILDLNIMTNDK